MGKRQPFKRQSLEDGLPVYFRLGASLVGLLVKTPPTSATDWGFNPWVGKVPWRREWQPTPVCLPGESQEQQNLEGYSSWGLKEPDTTKAT